MYLNSLMLGHSLYFLGMTDVNNLENFRSASVCITSNTTNSASGTEFIIALVKFCSPLFPDWPKTICAPCCKKVIILRC